MRKFRVWGTPLVNREDMHHWDKKVEYENIAQGHIIGATDEAEALEKFFDIQVIKGYEDWEFNLKELDPK